MWFNQMYTSKTCLDGKIVVITGASSGIGKKRLLEIYTRKLLTDFNDINVEKSYSPLKSYAQSKLANILFTKELVRRLKETNIRGINVYSVHSGIIPTEILRYSSSTIFPGTTFCFRLYGQLFCKNVVQGAQTTIYCSVDEEIANDTGLHYSNCGVATTYRKANDPQYPEKLWNVSCRLLHLEPEDDFADIFKNYLTSNSLKEFFYS